MVTLFETLIMPGLGVVLLTVKFALAVPGLLAKTVTVNVFWSPAFTEPTLQVTIEPELLQPAEAL
jgi:hypothetical protein